MRKNHIGLVLLIVAILSVTVLVFYKKMMGKAIQPLPVQEVTLRLKYLNQTQFAGNYVAIEKGFYEENGLKVVVQPVDFAENTIDAAVAGKIDFGIVGADEVLLARAAGKPVKAVAVIYKINPAAVVTIAGKGIYQPKDLIGKKVGFQKGNPIEYQFEAMMKSKGLDISKIKKVYIDYSVNDLLIGKIDATTGYITNEPDLVVQGGKQPSTLLMADYGVNIYADVLFTTEKMIESKPGVVESMVRGTLKGWQYAIENENEAVDITMKYATDTTRSHQAFMLHNSIPLINSGLNNLGMMDQPNWDQLQNILFDVKLLTKKINTSDAFTLDFLNEIYIK